MSKLSREIVEHHLPLKLECRQIQQKLRRMKPEMLLKIKEVKKQFDAGFLEVAKYLEWLTLYLCRKKMRKYKCVSIIEFKSSKPKG